MIVNLYASSHTTTRFIHPSFVLLPCHPHISSTYPSYSIVQQESRYSPSLDIMPLPFILPSPLLLRTFLLVPSDHNHNPDLSPVSETPTYCPAKYPNLASLTLGSTPASVINAATITAQSCIPSTFLLKSVCVAAATVASKSKKMTYPLTRCHLYSFLALSSPP